jgi:methylmalonyl-CoA mutase C-terminal domain/subunit
VVIAKPGLDGHDRGAKVIAPALRDAGYEVIYTDLHQTPEQIVATVIAEDAPILGLSVLSGAHLTIVDRVIKLLAEQEAGDTRLLVGGIIPDYDVAAVHRLSRVEPALLESA